MAYVLINNQSIEVGKLPLQKVLNFALKKMYESGRKKHNDKCTNARLRSKKRNELIAMGLDPRDYAEQIKMINISKYIIYTTCTLRTYKSHVRIFCKFLENKYGINNMTVNEAKKHIQEFVDHLVAEGKESTTIHNYLAGVCKAVGGHMFWYDRPPCHSVSIKGNPKPNDTKNADPALKVAEITGLRIRELKKFKIDDITFNDDNTAYIYSKGKGNKDNRTWILFPEDVDHLKECVLQANADGREYLLTKESVYARGAYHYRRALCAQKYYDALIDDFAKNPHHREECRTLIMDEFDRYNRKCKEDLDKTYHTRGVVRETAKNIGKPVSYDRMAVMYVSLFILQHFRSNVTVEHYLIK